jgi:hypothetical protein
VVVKIQLPLVTNSSEFQSQALVYNKDKSVNGLVNITEDLLISMSGRVKAYFEVNVDANGLSVIREVDGQEW